MAERSVPDGKNQIIHVTFFGIMLYIIQYSDVKDMLAYSIFQFVIRTISAPIAHLWITDLISASINYLHT